MCEIGAKRQPFFVRRSLLCYLFPSLAVTLLPCGCARESVALVLCIFVGFLLVLVQLYCGWRVCICVSVCARDCVGNCSVIHIVVCIGVCLLVCPSLRCNGNGLQRRRTSWKTQRTKCQGNESKGERKMHKN